VSLKHFYFITLTILIGAADAQSIGQITSSNVSPVAPVGSSEKAADNSLVDNKTLLGKVMCGYQGWFGAPGDGVDNGWRHWTKKGGSLADGNAKIDLWPDVSELSPAERFRTDFKLAGGQPAEVYSAAVKPTVLRHFQWMREYGIDGVFLQRFTHGLSDKKTLAHDNAVLSNCREGADTYGRTYAVMYDLSGMPGEQMSQVMDDWRTLKNRMGITKDRTYLFHRGKPLVAIWGVGFDNRRSYNLDECRQLIEFFKNDPEAGGCTIMLGVPAHWRELDHDAVDDPELLKIISMADVVSPWSVASARLITCLSFFQASAGTTCMEVHQTKFRVCAGNFFGRSFAQSSAPTSRWPMWRCSTKWMKAQPYISVPTMFQQAPGLNSSHSKGCRVIFI
jgi:hypothetical protein